MESIKAAPNYNYYNCHDVTLHRFHIPINVECSHQLDLITEHICRDNAFPKAENT